MTHDLVALARQTLCLQCHTATWEDFAARWQPSPEDNNKTTVLVYMALRCRACSQAKPLAVYSVLVLQPQAEWQVVPCPGPHNARHTGAWASFWSAVDGTQDPKDRGTEPLHRCLLCLYTVASREWLTNRAAEITAQRAIEMLRVSTDDGKYTCVQYKDGKVVYERHGEPWVGHPSTVATAPAKAALAFAYDLESTREELKALRERHRTLKLAMHGIAYGAGPGTLRFPTESTPGEPTKDSGQILLTAHNFLAQPPLKALTDLKPILEEPK